MGWWKITPVERIFRKLIKNKMLSGPYLVLWVFILGENCAYTSLLRTLEGLSFKLFNCSSSSHFSKHNVFCSTLMCSGLLTMNLSGFYKREERGRTLSFFCLVCERDGAGES